MFKILFHADRSIQVYIGNEFDSTGFDASTAGFKQCGGVYTVKKGASFYIHCYQTLVGRYVVVQMNALNSHFTVCEVEVYQEQGMYRINHCQKITKYHWHLRVSKSINMLIQITIQPLAIQKSWTFSTFQDRQDHFKHWAVSICK